MDSHIEEYLLIEPKPLNIIDAVVKSKPSEEEIRGGYEWHSSMPVTPSSKAPPSSTTFHVVYDSAEPHSYGNIGRRLF